MANQLFRQLILMTQFLDIISHTGYSKIFWKSRFPINFLKRVNQRINTYMQYEAVVYMCRPIFHRHTPVRNKTQVNFGEFQHLYISTLFLLYQYLFGQIIRFRRNNKITIRCNMTKFINYQHVDLSIANLVFN